MITSYSSTGGYKSKGGAMKFDCGTDLNGKNNCDVSLKKVTFQGLGSNGMTSGMKCSGVKGAATGLSGINDCLDNGPPPPPAPPAPPAPPGPPQPPGPPPPPGPPQPPGGTCAEQLEKCSGLAKKKCEGCADACNKKHPGGMCKSQQVRDFKNKSCTKT